MSGVQGAKEDFCRGLYSTSMDSLKLLEDLVAIRSDLHATCAGGRFEYELAMFLKKYIEEHFPHLVIEEQEIERGRFNLFVHDGFPVNLLFCGHMDCVEEGSGWTYNVRGERRGSRLYGRGSADMKSGLVTILAALDQAAKIGKKGVAALFYCDEEYDFLGMRQFVKAYGDRMKPKMVISSEPTSGLLSAATRGIVEFHVVMKGKTGHAAKPKTGIDAFKGFMSGVDGIKELLAGKEDAVLGKPNLNIAMIRCGALQGPSNDPAAGPVFGSMGNVIPDYCEAIVELRTIPGIDHKNILEAFNAGVKRHRAIVDSCTTTINLGSYVTPRDQLTLVEEVYEEVIGPVAYQSILDTGYYDTQMMEEIWHIPVVCWGPKGKNTHGCDEYVEIPSVEKLERAFRLFIDRWE